jgi:hypothetical protein
MLVVLATVSMLLTCNSGYSTGEIEMKKLITVTILLLMTTGCSDSKEAVLLTLKSCEKGNEVVITTSAGPFGASVSISCKFIKGE